MTHVTPVITRLMFPALTDDPFGRDRRSPDTEALLADPSGPPFMG